MSGTFVQKATETYKDLCGTAGLDTFLGLLDEVQKAYPMGPNGEDMHMALRALYSLADAASYQSASEIDSFLEKHCPRVPEGFRFDPDTALDTIDCWAEEGVTDGIGVRGISVEALARIIRQGGIMPRYISRDWKVEFTPYPQTIIPEMEQRGLSTAKARWHPHLTNEDALRDNLTFAKTNAVIAYLGPRLGLTCEFDGNGYQKDIDEPVTAYDLTHRHLDGTAVSTYVPDERTMRLGAEKGLSGRDIQNLLRRGLNREGVQLALDTSILDDFKVEVMDTGAGTAVIIGQNRALPLDYVTGIRFLGEPNDAYQSPEHEEIVKALKSATSP